MTDAISPKLPELSESARQQIAPGGTIRVAIAVGPAGSALWTMRDPATGKPSGVTVELAVGLSSWSGLPTELVEFDSSGAITNAAASGTWDVTFVPVDTERKKSIDFGPNYFLGESTYMVKDKSPYATVDDVNRSGVRIVGVEGTATLRSCRRSLTETSAEGVDKLDEALALFKQGKVDAVALGKESLYSLLPKLPGARLTAGRFHAAGTAIGVPKGHADALEIATVFIEHAKSGGMVRAAFDRHGMASSSVAPFGSRS